jgi:DNA-binding SARP family transcriptional activator
MADCGEMPEHVVKDASNSGFSYAFFLLGEPRIARAGLAAALPSQRAWSLLAVLLLRPDISRRKRLAEHLFPDLLPRTGRRRLSDLLWLIRAALPDLPLVADAHELALPLSVRWLDTEAFVREATLPDLDAWLRALALYRGDLCAGLYGEWLLHERENIYLQYVTIAHRAADALLRAGRAEEALAIGERLVRDEPYDERALRMLMRAQSALGAEALLWPSMSATWRWPWMNWDASRRKLPAHWSRRSAFGPSLCP